MSSPPSTTSYGGTSTITFTTTITATPSELSATIFYPEYTSSTTLYTVLTEPSNLASQYFSTSLPILVLTDVVGIIVSTNGVPIVTRTLVQPLPSGQPTGSSASSMNPASTSNSASDTGCAGGWDYLSSAQQAGIIIGIVVSVLLILGLMLCCYRRRHKKGRDGDEETHMTRLPRRSRSVRSVRGAGSVSGGEGEAGLKEGSFVATPSRPYMGVGARDFAVAPAAVRGEASAPKSERKRSVRNREESRNAEGKEHGGGGEGQSRRNTRWDDFYTLPAQLSRPKTGEQRYGVRENVARPRQESRESVSMRGGLSTGTRESYRDSPVMVLPDRRREPESLGRSLSERRTNQGRGYEREKETIPARRSTKRGPDNRRARSLSPPRRHPPTPRPKRRNSEHHDHSKWLALLPLALQTIHVLAEPSGGWEKYSPKENNHRGPIKKLAKEFTEKHIDRDSTPPPIPPRNPARLAKNHRERRRSRSIDQAYESARSPRHSRAAAPASKRYPPNSSRAPEVGGENARSRKGFEREISDASMIPHVGSDQTHDGSAPRRRISRSDARRNWEGQSERGI